MKFHKKFEHDLPGIGYWGERADVALRVNFGCFEPGESFPHDPLHYHKTRTTFFCILTGSLLLEIEGKELNVTSETMLEIEPLEKYRVVRIGKDGCRYIVIGSHNKEDRFEV